jgi:hypothetical protein
MAMPPPPKGGKLKDERPVFVLTRKGFRRALLIGAGVVSWSAPIWEVERPPRQPSP